MPTSAVSQGQSVRFGIKGVPALGRDPKLELLTRLGGDHATHEIIQYLNGSHPAFLDQPPASPKQVFDKLASSSPIKFGAIDGKVEAFNEPNVSTNQISERSAQLHLIRRHLSDLMEEAEARQIPEALVRRLARYGDRATEKDPLFLSLDAPMSFLRGALGDTYIREATDAGFVEACNYLVELHDHLRANYVESSDELEKLVAESTAEVTPDVLADAVEESIAAVSTSVVSDDVGKSVVSAMRELQDYVETAKANIAQPNLVVRGLIVLSSVLAALANGASIHLWSATKVGVEFVATIREILTRILTALNLL